MDMKGEREARSPLKASQSAKGESAKEMESSPSLKRRRRPEDLGSLENASGPRHEEDRSWWKAAKAVFGILRGL